MTNWKKNDRHFELVSLLMDMAGGARLLVRICCAVQ